MKLLRNSLPVVCFAVLVLFWIGWMWLGWRTTPLIPWSAALLTLGFCSLTAAISPSPAARKTAGFLTILSVIPCVLLVTGWASFSTTWSWLALAGLCSAVIYLHDLAYRSGVYTGVVRYVLLVPVGLIVYAVIALFGWNGSLLPAWIGLALLVVVAFIGLVVRRRN